MRVDMVRTVLRVIFDDEDCCTAPQAAMGDPIDQSTDALVVVSDIGERGFHSRSRTCSVIVTHGHDKQLWSVAMLIELFPFAQELVRPIDVRNSQVEGA